MARYKGSECMSDTKLAKASYVEAKTYRGSNEGGGFYMPWQSIDNRYQKAGLSPEKLIIPRA